MNIEESWCRCAARKARGYSSPCYHCYWLTQDGEKYVQITLEDWLDVLSPRHHLVDSSLSSLTT